MSLVESAVATVIVGVMLVAALNTVGAARLGQLNTSNHRCGHLLAQQLLTEILPQSYQVLPDNVDATTGNPLPGRNGLNDLADYDGWIASPPQWPDGTDVAGWNNWTRRVEVDWVDLTNLSQTRNYDTGVRRITVEAWRGQVPMAKLVALKTSTAGLTAAYYALSNDPLSLSDVDFAATPSNTGIASQINQPGTSSPAWPGGPNDYFAVRYNGLVIIPQDGAWTFTTESDDGSKLWIDGQLVVDNDGLHSMRVQSGTVNLTAGPRRIEVRVFERTGSYGLIVSWQGPGINSRQTIPASAFDSGIDRGGF